MNEKKSILILGHAQGGTSTTYELTVAHTPLRGKRQVGEVLNVHRFPTLVRFGHHVDPSGNPRAWQTAQHVLATHARGWVIKDVVNLDLCERFIRERPSAFHVLIVDRDPRDVIATRLKNGHPAPIAAGANPFAKSRRLRAIAAELACAALVEFPRVIESGDALNAALSQFGYTQRLVGAFDAHWHAKREKKLAAVAAARERYAEQIEQLAAEAAAIEQAASAAGEL